MSYVFSEVKTRGVLSHVHAQNYKIYVKRTRHYTS